MEPRRAPVGGAGWRSGAAAGGGYGPAGWRARLPHKFGEGTVQVIEGSGADARAQVRFLRHGVKWLALGIAKLTVVE